jgi:CheY-like chemotaxis protein
MKERQILLVEDNPDDIELTKRALRRSNIVNELVVVTDGAEALDFMFGTGRYSGSENQESPAIVLLDLKLPKVDGHEVLRRIRADARSRLTPVVILTSSNEDQDLITAYSNGANSFIRKPVDFVQFAGAVQQLGLYWLILNEPPPK